MESKHFILYDQKDEGIIAKAFTVTVDGTDGYGIEYSIDGTDNSGPGAEIFRGLKAMVVETPSYSVKADFSGWPEIVYSAPFYSNIYGDHLGISNLFYVKLRNQNDETVLSELAEKYNITVVGKNPHMPLWYTLACSRESAGSALEMANLFYETGKFVASEPDKMVDLIQSVNDPLFADQWNLSNTMQHGGTRGVDINFLNGRYYSTGSSDITIAVLDQGVQMNHPDIPNIHPFSYDAQTSSSSSIVRGNHGTACAGIIGAATNNSIGIAGIAPGCRLMSISHDLILGTNTVQQLANGFYMATHSGADIISNSWGHNDLQHSLLDDAIQYALTYGRGGKGCIVVFAAGNDNRATVGYPARSHPDIIAVGAMAPDGRRKIPGYFQAPSEGNWGSNYGSELDIVAPGTLIPTTDRTGNDGYNKGSDYFMYFNGTSSACPHVAAVAGLMLSINPDLTNRDVKKILEKTAKKVGGYDYQITPDRPNGSWNREVGYGLVDALAAIRGSAPCSPGEISKRLIITNGPSLIYSYSPAVCHSENGYYQWEVNKTGEWEVIPDSNTLTLEVPLPDQFSVDYRRGHHCDAGIIYTNICSVVNPNYASDSGGLIPDKLDLNLTHWNYMFYALVIPSEMDAVAPSGRITYKWEINTGDGWRHIFDYDNTASLNSYYITEVPQFLVRRVAISDYGVNYSNECRVIDHSHPGDRSLGSDWYPEEQAINVRPSGSNFHYRGFIDTSGPGFRDMDRAGNYGNDGWVNLHLEADSQVEFVFSSYWLGKILLQITPRSGLDWGNYIFDEDIQVYAPETLIFDEIDRELSRSLFLEAGLYTIQVQGTKNSNAGRNEGPIYFSFRGSAI
ncbi:MAG: S8 family serine peptidase [Alistipes sp.]|nr:S8 family serine peptidase [Alistipes sp.]